MTLENIFQKKWMSNGKGVELSCMSILALKDTYNYSVSCHYRSTGLSYHCQHRQDSSRHHQYMYFRTLGYQKVYPKHA